MSSRMVLLMALFFLSACATPRWTVESVEGLRVTVYVASDQEHFERPQFEANHKVRGYATRTGEIWVLGRMDSEGRIHPDLQTLGHELAHHLHWQAPDRFADPDK